jgi:hypothetical protein
MLGLDVHIGSLARSGSKQNLYLALVEYNWSRNNGVVGWISLVDVVFLPKTSFRCSIVLHC